jgi:hypothetical protein
LLKTNKIALAAEYRRRQSGDDSVPTYTDGF